MVCQRPSWEAVFGTCYSTTHIGTIVVGYAAALVYVFSIPIVGRPSLVVPALTIWLLRSSDDVSHVFFFPHPRCSKTACFVVLQYFTPLLFALRRVVMMLMITLYVPIMCYFLVIGNRPAVVRFDKEGVEKEFTGEFARHNGCVSLPSLWVANAFHYYWLCSNYCTSPFYSQQGGARFRQRRRDPAG